MISSDYDKKVDRGFKNLVFMNLKEKPSNDTFYSADNMLYTSQLHRIDTC